jgi:hypothetical protein
MIEESQFTWGNCVTIFLNVVARGGTVRWNRYITPDLCLATSWLHDLIYHFEIYPNINISFFCMTERDARCRIHHAGHFNQGVVSYFFNSFCFCRYIEEHVQRTGVAIETQGFTFVTSGRKRETLTVSLQFHILLEHLLSLTSVAMNWQHG